MHHDSVFYYIHVPVIDMREKPSSKSEVLSQALFSEQVLSIAENADWIRVETTVDGYQGWIRKEGIHFRKTPYLSDPQKVVQISRCAAHLYEVEDTIYGAALTLPFESLLEVVDLNVNSSDRWLKVVLPDGRKKFVQRGDVMFAPKTISLNEMLAFSTQFLGLPYTWGGRSSFGYDCSGYVQMLYRLMGVYLPRDSKDQCRWDGFKNVDLKLMTPGDLIFFGMDKDNIRHVGMFLGDGRFIHTSATGENAPYLRICKLSDPKWNGSGHYPYLSARTLV